MPDKDPNQEDEEQGTPKKTYSEDDVSEAGCCGCCIGLAVGYLIWSGSGDCATTEQYQKHVQTPTEVTETYDGSKLEQKLLSGIDHYQKNISPKIKEQTGKDKLCKYNPSCSAYAKEAIEKYGPVKGSLKAAKRLAKCNPLSQGGEDPVD